MIKKKAASFGMRRFFVPRGLRISAARGSAVDLDCSAAGMKPRQRTAQTDAAMANLPAPSEPPCRDRFPPGLQIG
jgi:hypothetical protein